MQKQLSSDDSLGILKKPEHILSFIKHALEKPRQPEPSQGKATLGAGLRMESLRIVSDGSEDELEEGDSDDEEGGGEGLPEQSLDDMTSTAVKLLLSVLEGTSRAPPYSMALLKRDLQRTPTYLHETPRFLMTSFRYSNHYPKRRARIYARSHERRGWS